MARQEGTFKLNGNFEPRVNAPLDARLVVPIKTELYNLEYTYRGMRVYVEDEKTHYELLNDLPQYEASWKENAPGSGYDLVEVTTAEIDAMFT